jgi:hypothetical protein
MSSDSGASHLYHPFLSRTLGNPGDRDPSRFSMQKKENIIGCQAAPREYFNGKRVDFRQDGQVRANELRPGRLLASLWSRSDPKPTWNVSHGLIRNVVAKIL